MVTKRYEADLKGNITPEVVDDEEEEDKQIAENMKDYWKHLNSGAESNW